jgi:transglutaminase-like putative cysteine protease
VPSSYSIRHVTRFTYASPVSESVMELRMRPATDAVQRCLQFDLQLQPRARVFAYQDSLGNWVHHFDLPRRHAQLSITARAHVQIDEPALLPAALDRSSWDTVDQWVGEGEHWDFRQPSRFAEWTDALIAFAAEVLGPSPRDRDPLTLVRDTTRAIHEAFEYAPKSTRVDSPIGEALAARQGVCQDFTHVMLATLRRLPLPCRYVSGYLAPEDARSADSPMTIATHAWVEVLLPELGWIGVDPTNGIEAGLRHIRVGIGRDYADVPPTRGVFKGGASSTLAVAVEVTQGAVLPTLDPAVTEASWVAEAQAVAADDAAQKQTQQQQQQQQQ